MDIRDFEGIYKYKFFIPLLYVFSWCTMFTGPIYYPKIYQFFTICLLGYMAIKSIVMFTIMIIVNVKGNRIFKRAINERKSTYRERVGNQEIYFGIIVPNYKQDIEMLAQTLTVLAQHRIAKQQYFIMLAMEAHEQGSTQKACELIERFKNSFRFVQYSSHKLRQYQFKSKASNVSWCIENLEPIFQKYSIDPESVFLTVIDSDSWAPQVYFHQVEDHIIKNPLTKHITIYQPPQIFTRNCLQVPIFTRVYDLMHSFAHCSSLFSVFNITFALSNYTMSYKYIKRIGFWDTCADAIGQDFRITQKAFWKTGGELIAHPIYVPFNQVNIATGRSYFEDVKARFWQAQRHAQGVTDVAYNLKMFFNTKFRFKNLILMFLVAQLFALPAIVPWVFISLFFQNNILPKYQQVSQSPMILTIFFNILSVFSTVAYFLLQLYKRRANKIIYGTKNESLFRCLEYPIIFSVNFFAISMPTFVIAAFGILLKPREWYIAAKKNVVGKTNTQEIL